MSTFHLINQPIVIEPRALRIWNQLAFVNHSRMHDERSLPGPTRCLPPDYVAAVIHVGQTHTEQHLIRVRREIRCCVFKLPCRDSMCAVNRFVRGRAVVVAENVEGRAGDLQLSKES